MARSKNIVPLLTMLKKSIKWFEIIILNIFLLANWILLNKTSKSGNANSDPNECPAIAQMALKNCLMCADYKKDIAFVF